MSYLCALRISRNFNVGKLRLCSSNFLINNHPQDSNYSNCLLSTTLSKRHFSLKSSVESIIQTQSGIFQAISESSPVLYTQEFLLDIHSTTGLPWWATIIVTTVLLRTCIAVPLAVYQHYIIAKLENLQLELREIAVELNKETAAAVKAFHWDERYARLIFRRSLKKQWNNLVVRENCHPFKASLLLWVQLPLWVCLSVSFRNLLYMLPNSDNAAYVTFTQLMLEGFAWIPNLTVNDTTFILPVTLGLVNLIIVEIQALSRKKAPTRIQRYLTNFFRGFSILIIPISASVPSCLTLYWTTSSIHALAQNLLLMSPKLKRMTGIPETASEIKQPYLHLVTKFKSRFQLKKNKDLNS